MFPLANYILMIVKLEAIMIWCFTTSAEHLSETTQQHCLP